MREIKKGDICVIPNEQGVLRDGAIVKVGIRLYYSSSIKNIDIFNNSYNYNNKADIHNNKYLRLATHKERVLRILILANTSIDLTDSNIYKKEMNIDKMKHYINE